MGFAKITFFIVNIQQYRPKTRSAPHTAKNFVNQTAFGILKNRLPHSPFFLWRNFGFILL